MTKAIVITDEMLEKTRDLAKAGVKSEFIAADLGMSEPTFFSKPALMKVYHKELAKISKLVCGSLIQKAREGDTTSQIFIAKTRARWGTQSYIKMDKFKGDYKQKMKAIDEVFKAGVMNVNNYIGLSRTLTDQFRVDEQETRFRALEEKMGIKSD
jgi:hypothetical protein